VDLVCQIKHALGIESMAHLTCVGASRQEIRSVLQRLRDGGIENVLALRGDPPRQEGAFVPPADGFRYAAQLVRYIREEMPGDFCLGGACYPEGHPETPDREADLQNFVAKAEAGLDFAITQLFFDNRDYFKFVERAHSRGVRIAIIPGIMPITNVSQIERFTAMCGAHIPESLRAKLAAAEPNEEKVRQVGIAHATAQCRELLERGAPGIHFYTLNQSPATRAILEQLRG
jgi:methylenetetrahydrofolate reductase (NADPH)